MTGTSLANARSKMLGLILFACVTAPPLGAEETELVRFVDDPGAAERLEAADRLRTLSHEVGAAACHLAGGIDPEVSRKLMVEAKEDFIRIIAALRHGDEGLRIRGEEADPGILADLAVLDEEWAVTEDAVRRLMADPADGAALATIKAESERLYDTSNHLFSELNEEYTRPFDLLMVDALQLDIVGRQAMLTQKMSKEACEIWTGNRAEDRMAALLDSKGTFELGMQALLDGMPQLSLPPAPTPDIRRRLEVVLADWEIVQGHMALVKDDTIGEAEKADLYARLNDKMYKLEDLVHMYTAYSKHDYGPALD
ncbi:MAG: type IV pili methyl-accepting chemotaxis transducer N-terminal domain-containing protein [Pseudomonadota bacterium]